MSVYECLLRSRVYMTQSKIKSTSENKRTSAVHAPHISLRFTEGMFLQQSNALRVAHICSISHKRALMHLAPGFQVLPISKRWQIVKNLK